MQQTVVTNVLVLDTALLSPRPSVAAAAAAAVAATVAATVAAAASDCL
jgi:hypothetical protein